MAPRPRAVRALVVVVAGVLLAGVTTVSAAHADPVYPSWDDVKAARVSEAATKAQIGRIQGFLDDLESKAIALSVHALQKGERYNIARDALDAAARHSATLEAQADAAKLAAAESAARAGHLVAQLVRTGGGSITVQLLVDGAGADDLLSKLGTMTKLTEQSAEVITRAQTDENSARSLGAQARLAENERAKLAADAETVLAEANAAARAAEAKIATQAAASDRLNAQLIALSGDADAAEQAYRDGLAWEAAQNAARPPGATNPPVVAPPVTAPPVVSPPVVAPPVVSPPVVAPPVVSPPVVVPPVVAPPVVVPPAPGGGPAAAAIAYARAQLGEAYGFGGAGPSVWDCSGLTKMSYASVGVYIGTHSVTNQYSTMANAGRLVPVGQRTAGDLLFYSTGGNTVGEKYHVAIYIGGGQMIEAPRAGVPVRITGVRGGDLVPFAGRPTG